MYNRFARARTAELRCPGGALRAVVADDRPLRLLGLMRLDAAEVVPLLLPRCRSIHTHGMRTPIDLVWLALEAERARVLGVVESLGRGRHQRFRADGVARRTVAALELSPGEAQRLGLVPGATVGVS